MFALDRSLKAIVTTEQDVVAVYHSTFAVNAAFPGVGQLTCESYICAVQDGNAIRVHVALIDSVDRKVHIYSTGNACRGNDSCQEMLKDALRFAESLGFSMEPVNLNYGKALREVIIRGIRPFSLISGGKKNSPSPSPQVNPAGIPPANGGVRDKQKKPSDEPSEEKFFVEEAALDISLVEEAPVEAAPVKAAPVEAAPVEEVQVEATPIGEVQVEEVQVEAAPVEEVQVEEVQVEEVQVEEAQVEEAPIEEAPIEEAPIEEVVVEEAAVEESPVSGGSEEIAPALERIESVTPHPPLQKDTAEVMPPVREPMPVAAIFADETPADQGQTAKAGNAVDGVSIDSLEASLQLAVAAENRAEGNVAEAMVTLETASADRLERERVLAEKNTAEQVLAAQVDAARCAWERTETERVDCERLLVDTAKAERSAEEMFEKARRALEAAKAERCEREKELEELAAAELRAANGIDRVRQEWENSESERVEWENLLVQSRESEQQAEETVASALKELEDATAVRSEQEKLLKAEQLARRTASLREARSRRADMDKGEARPDSVLSGEVPASDVTEEVALPGNSMIPDPTSPGISGVQSVVEVAAAADAAAGEPAQPARAAWPEDAPASRVETVASPFSSPFDSSPSPFASADSGSPFASDDESAASTFAIDYSLQTIELGKNDQVTDFYQSLNMVRLTIENLPSQNSSAFLCAVNRNGVYAIYFALFLSDSRRAIVYCPGKQPVTAADKEKVVMEGIGFAETVGFIMDPVPLGGRDKQAQQLGRSPVFSFR